MRKKETDFIKKAKIVNIPIKTDVLGDQILRKIEIQDPSIIPNFYLKIDTYLDKEISPEKRPYVLYLNHSSVKNLKPYDFETLKLYDNDGKHIHESVEFIVYCISYQISLLNNLIFNYENGFLPGLNRIGIDIAINRMLNILNDINKGTQESMWNGVYAALRGVYVDSLIQSTIQIINNKKLMNKEEFIMYSLWTFEWEVGFKNYRKNDIIKYKEYEYLLKKNLLKKIST